MLIRITHFTSYKLLLLNLKCFFFFFKIHILWGFDSDRISNENRSQMPNKCSTITLGKHFVDLNNSHSNSKSFLFILAYKRYNKFSRFLHKYLTQVNPVNYKIFH